MKNLTTAVIGAMTMLALGAAGEVRAQGTGSSAVYQVTYVEVMPAAKTSATALLRQLGSASRGAAGNQRFEILQRRDRPNHFAIIETWRDQAAEDANLAAGHMKQFREKLQPMLSSAYDERPHTGLAVGPIDAGGGSKGAAVYAVTHVDIIPPKKDDGIAALQQLAEPSRKDAGNLRYEVLQQNSRPNHFTLVEIWRAQSAVENHEVSPHTRKFREMLLPMSGSLYDQRLYRALQP